MSIILASTTESKEAVKRANEEANKAPLSDVQKSAATQEIEKAETADDSDSSEVMEDETDLDAKDGDSDDESESEGEESKEGKPKQKTGFKRRLDKLTKRASLAEEEREYWKAQALKGKEQTTKDEPKKTVEAQGKPKPDAFDTHEDYLEALSDWKTEQKFQEREAKAKADKANEERSAKQKTLVEKIDTFKASHEDFADLMDDVDDIPLSNSVNQAIAESDDPPALMYALAKNRKELERISKLSPAKAILELGKVEARITRSTESEETEIKTTKAPKPIEPVGKSASRTVRKSIYEADKMTQAEYEKARKDMMRARA